MRAPSVLAGIAIVVLAGGGYLYWSSLTGTRVPAGLAIANGRVEVERVDIAAKLPGRVAEIRVKEGYSSGSGISMPPRPPAPPCRIQMVPRSP